MKLSENKKGLDAFSLVLTILAIAALTFILIGTVLKHSEIRAELGAAGNDALFLLGVYDEADDALLYIDSAAKLALQKATYELGQNCFGSDCKWTSGDIHEGECKPEFNTRMPEGVAEDSYRDAFIASMGPYIKTLENIEEDKTLHKKTYKIYENFNDRYAYNFNPTPDETGTEVIATTTIPYVIERDLEASSSKVTYSVKPSFRERIDISIFEDFREIKRVASELAGYIDGALLDAEGERTGSVNTEEFKDEVERYNSDDSNLRWSVGIIDYICSDCSKNKGCAEPKCQNDQQLMSPHTSIDLVCTECVLRPGVKKQEYCSFTAYISVKIVDNRFEVDDTFNLRQFYSASDEEFKHYEYKFNLNWYEMKGGEKCEPTGARDIPTAASTCKESSS